MHRPSGCAEQLMYVWLYGPRGILVTDINVCTVQTLQRNHAIYSVDNIFYDA